MSDKATDSPEEYVRSLEARIETLTKANASLRAQLESLRRAASRRYRDQEDYVPYHEED